MYDVIGGKSTRAFRVLWALEELGVPYTHLPANPRDPAVIDLNASGKVPILKDGDAVITDSTAIITYLSDKHQNLTSPAGTIERAHQDALTHAILDEIDAVIWTAARHSFVLPKEHRVAEVKPSLKWEFARNLDRIADRIDGPYVCGDAFTIADIILTHCLNWAFSAKFEHENAIMQDYAKRMRSRDAFKRVKALG